MLHSNDQNQKNASPRNGRNFNSHQDQRNQNQSNAEPPFDRNDFNRCKQYQERIPNFSQNQGMMPQFQSNRDQNNQNPNQNQPNMNRQLKCHAEGCTVSHATHKCRKCGKIDSDHLSSQCKNRCKVHSCTRPHKFHFCRKCKNFNSNHYTTNCRK